MSSHKLDSLEKRKSSFNSFLDCDSFSVLWIGNINFS